MIIPHVVVIDIIDEQTANELRQLQCLIALQHVRVSASQLKRAIIFELNTSSDDTVLPIVFRLP